MWKDGDFVCFNISFVPFSDIHSFRLTMDLWRASRATHHFVLCNSCFDLKSHSFEWLAMIFYVNL